MTDWRVASGGDYSTRVVKSLFSSGQARGLKFSGASIINRRMGFLEPSEPGYSEAFEGPSTFDLLHTTIYWADFRHPAHDNIVELMYDARGQRLGWLTVRDMILGSEVGSRIYNTSPTLQEPDDLPEDRLKTICADAGIPYSVYLLGRTSVDIEGPNIAFLWHPNIMASTTALGGLQAALTSPPA